MAYISKLDRISLESRELYQKWTEIPPPEILERQKDGIETLIPDERVSADPNDDYLYYLALDTMADYLMSGDSHLLQISSDRVSILSPRRFWEVVMVPRL